ncbi:MAG: hypothetical protein AAGJ18_02895 [Bacteroidota bacterium]
MDAHILDYWKREGLDQYFSATTGADEQAIPMDKEDLVRLHQLIRQRKSFTVLEFGVGFSTVIIADALKKNKADWLQLKSQPKIRNRFMFQCFSVDTSEEWIAVAKNRLPVELQVLVHFQYSKVEIGTFNGQLCHFYKNLPDIVPDFIYLDGPDPKAVEGSINGMTFQCSERTVMSGDLLLMEPILLPGTFVLVDGRTNNVRFLKNKRYNHKDYERLPFLWFLCLHRLS